MARSKEEMAALAACELNDGDVVNLGIGIPTLVANYLPPDRKIWLHSENGLLGMGPFPYEGEEDPKIINAGKQTVTVVDGGSFFDSSTSFAMIRGGHLDLAILGAMEVSAGRPCELDDSWQEGQWYGRSHGPGQWCKASHRTHVSHRQERQLETSPTLHATAHRRGMCSPNHYRSSHP